MTHRSSCTTVYVVVGYLVPVVGLVVLAARRDVPGGTIALASIAFGLSCLNTASIRLNHLYGEREGTQGDPNRTETVLRSIKCPGCDRVGGNLRVIEEDPRHRGGVVRCGDCGEKWEAVLG